MSGNKYVPVPDAQFCEWSKIILNYSKLHHERWGVMAPDENLISGLIDLKTKVDKCAEPTRSRVDTLVKNTARKAVERGMRHYLQGMVMHNIYVTIEDRQMMGLPIYDRVSTPVGDPVGIVSASVKYVNEGALELQIAHVEGSPYDKRANYGVKIVYEVLPFDAPAPVDINTIRNTVFTRRKKELFIFGKHEAGHKAWFCMRYENGKGKAGQWGPVFSAVIP